LRTNLAGFANFDMSRARRSDPVHAPGDYRVRVLVPPGFAVTTGSAEQSVRVAPLAGAPSDLAVVTPAASIGIAPELFVAGRIAGANGAPGGPPGGAARLTASRGAEVRDVPVAADGTFGFPAQAGSWQLRASTPGGDRALERTIVVRDAPVHVGGLFFG